MTNKILTGQNCLITGASRGLGATIASTFWKAGANLILVARSKEGLARVVNDLSSQADQHVITLVADLSDPLAADQIINKARKAFDTLEVLVNNAAIQGPIGPVWENDWHEWQRTLQVNLLSPIKLCRLCVPWMAQQGGGKMINLSGGGATSPRANFSAYGTTKVGLVRFTETLAQETRHLGIHVNSIAPGAMNTAMLTTIVQAGEKAAGQKEYELALNVRESGGISPKRSAELCLFLGSPASDGMTGKLISAKWDPWETLAEHRDELWDSDIYTLRRIIPKDRGLGWGDR